MLDELGDGARPERDEWRLELVCALGGNVDDVQAALIEAVISTRRMIPNLARIEELRWRTASCMVRLARNLRRLGLTRHDVHQLDLGRRRRRVVH